MRKYFGFFLLLLLVSSCTGDLNVPYDWCYTLDYTDNQDGTSIGSGDWSFGLGMYPDEDGDLVFAYVHDINVSWTQVIVNFELPIASVVPLSLQGGVFGSPIPYTSVTVNTTTQNVYTAYFYPSQAQSSGRTITAIVHAPFVPESTFLQSIEIRGTGTNPFPTNDCAEDPTPTPSNTPESGMWCYTFDFTASSYSTIGAEPGFYQVTWGDGYTGSGWSSEDYSGTQELNYLALILLQN